MKKQLRRYLAMATAGILAAITLMSVPVAAKAKETVQSGYKSYSYEDGKYKLDYQWTGTFNKKGYVSKTTSKSRDFESGKMGKEEVTTYKYDKKGNRTEAVTKVGGKNTTKETFRYDKKGQLTRIDNYTAAGGKWKKTGYTTYTRTKSKSTTKEYEGKKLVRQSVAKLDKKGRSVETKYYSGKELTSVYKYQYDKKGNTTKIATTDYSDGKATSKSVITMKYNKYGQMTKEVYQGGDYTNTTTYKYSNFFKGNKRYPKTVIQSSTGYKSKETRAYKVINR